MSKNTITKRTENKQLILSSGSRDNRVFNDREIGCPAGTES